MYVASESTEARRIIPRALLQGTFLVTGLYLVLNLIFVTSVPFADLIWKEDIAAISASRLGGAWLEFLVRIAVTLGLLSSVSGMVLSGPRVYAKMADDGVFPKLFAVERNGLRKSVALQTLLAVSLILLQRILVDAGIIKTPLLGLLKYLGTTLSLSSACCVATLFLPKIRAQDKQRPVWVSAAAVTYIAATITAIVLLVLSHEEAGHRRGLWHLTGAAVTIGGGLLAWRFVGRKNTRSYHTG